ncbi:MAG: hypothetical protein A3G24_20505 [Betaproteobacteria bacterium RIFCSPLOWO2_12_FULL_62_13]|nr:MAG: hypothetical protein A3G24_20505 [Betaproteobacteria bacterium RIFCSPLOWO2_12_FULL_62_13]
MFEIPKQEYTAEFKELAVKRVKDGRRTGAVARDLGPVEQMLRDWVQAVMQGKLNPAGGKAVTPQQMELSRTGHIAIMASRGEGFDSIRAHRLPRAHQP